MRTRTRFILTGLIVVVMGLGHLLGGPSIPPRSAFRLNPAELQRLAAADGPLPVSLHRLLIGRAAYPGFAVRAWAGLRRRALEVAAFQVRYADGSYAILDTAGTRAEFEKNFIEPYYSDEAWKTLQQALPKARAIAVTHEHFDHISGVRAGNLAQLAPALRLTKEQIETAPRNGLPGFTAQQQSAITAFDCPTACSVAPGIVMLRAPGHTPGSVMLFVKLASGHSFLMIGDIAWSRPNIDLLTSRPRLVSLMMGEDSDQVVNQLRALYDLRATAEAQQVHIIVAHDPDDAAALIQTGLIRDGFSF